MKKITLISCISALMVICMNGFSQNIQLKGTLGYGSTVLANIGGYVDSTDLEYALVGTYDGLDIVDVTDPVNPVIRFSVPGAQSSWREVKTYRNYAYVTTEGGGGLTIVDLSGLPGSVNQYNYTGDGIIAGQLDAIHALHCDTAKGFLYLYGSNLFNGCSVFLDLSDPWNPVYAGHYTYAPEPYVHDGYVMNDTMYEGHIYGGFFTIVDVSDKANPVLLATQNTPTAFTHNTWLSDDHRTLFTTDENSSSFLAAFDVSDPANIQELSRFQTASGSGSIVHNTHILNDFAITSWYKEGVVITDVSRPHNPIEVGSYDTYPQGSGNGFNGCWGVYPFLPSGNIVASDIDNGLFVLSPTYIRGCYLEGKVTDSITNGLLSGALISIVSNPTSTTSNVNGEYATGLVIAGTYDLSVSKPGYFNKMITGVSLANGVLTPLDIEMVPLPTFVFNGMVTDSMSTQPVGNAMVILQSPALSYTTSSDVSGFFSFPGVVGGNYELITGKWGYQTQCSTVNLSQSTTLSTELVQGYYDDFTFDFGWTVTGTTSNAWERGEPVGTYDNSNTEINPDFDVTSDCGENCFVTDNGGAPYNNHDIDNGFTSLYSPNFDGTIYINPEISYYRRFLDINGVGTPNDSMVISILNGTDSVNLEMIGPNDPDNGSWSQRTFSLNGITLTTTMQLVVRVFDDAPGNICEGAFDQFMVTGQLNVATTEVDNDIISIHPNPFTGSIIINLKSNNYDKLSKVIIRDVAGRIVYNQPLTSSVIYPGNLNAGIYFIELALDSKKVIFKLLKIESN